MRTAENDVRPSNPTSHSSRSSHPSEQPAYARQHQHVEAQAAEGQAACLAAAGCLNLRHTCSTHLHIDTPLKVVPKALEMQLQN